MRGQLCTASTNKDILKFTYHTTYIHTYNIHTTYIQVDLLSAPVLSYGCCKKFGLLQTHNELDCIAENVSGEGLTVEGFEMLMEHIKVDEDGMVRVGDIVHLLQRK